MKKFLFLVSISLFMFIHAGHAQTEADKKARIVYMTPGEYHKWMALANGTWTDDVNTYTVDVATPTTTTATSTYKMLYNGLYQVHEWKGIMNGQPYEGQSILAYDNGKKQFVNIVLDNSGSGVGYYVGNFDPATKTLILKGNQYDPLTQKDIPVRQEIRFLNDDTQTITFFAPGTNGKEYKMMDIKLVRNKER